MNSVNAIGGDISTIIRQASFDPYNIELFMYGPGKATVLYAREIKKATWNQIKWKDLESFGGTEFGSKSFFVNGFNSNFNNMDYLLAFAVEAIFPALTLKNTAAPEPYRVNFATSNMNADASDLFESGGNLYYYLSDGKSGFPKGTLIVGTQDALTLEPSGLGLPESCSQYEIVSSAPNAGGNVGSCSCSKCVSDDCPCAVVRPFVSYTPRHRVAWGQHALLAAHEALIFKVGDYKLEELDRHALYNATLFRQREDIYPVAGEEATSLDAIVAQASVGSAPQAVLLADEYARKRSFVAPFSFTTSALADRGTDRGHQSAFPVLLSCKSHTTIEAELIDDLRKLLILEEEVLPDFAGFPVTFVSAGTDDFGSNQSMYISQGTDIWEIPFESFEATTTTIRLPGSNSTRVVDYLSTAAKSSYTVIVKGEPQTFSASSPFTVADLGADFLQQTGCFLPVTRPVDRSLDNPFSCKSINYRDWIVEDKPELRLKGKALSARATDLERGMLRADCRSKKYLYERYYHLSPESCVKPGDSTTVDITAPRGQLKYAYVVVQNELSRLQGQFFNYTNDTDYCVRCTKTGPRFHFEGCAALDHITSYVEGFKDLDADYQFLRYADNPLVAARAPRVVGPAIGVRFNNNINAIQPDGSVNAQAINDVRLVIRTRRSGDCNCSHSAHYGKANTYGYNVLVIAVAWNVLLFETVSASCKAPPAIRAH